MITNQLNAHGTDEKLNPNQHIRDVSKHIALYLNAQERTHSELVLLLRDALSEYNRAYWSSYFNRTTEIKALETALQEGVFNKKSESTKSVSSIFLEIIHHAKWKNDGFNAELIRVILKQLNNYDKKIKFKDDNIHDVLSLLANDIAVRKENDKKIGDQQAKLNELETRIFEANNKLLLKKKELTETTLALIKTNEQLEENIATIKWNNQLLATQQKEIHGLEEEKSATLERIQANLAKLGELEIQQKDIDEKIIAANHCLATILPDVNFEDFYDASAIDSATIQMATKNATIEFKGTMMAAKEKKNRMDELQQVKKEAETNLRSARRFDPNQLAQYSESEQNASNEAAQNSVKTDQQKAVEEELKTLKTLVKKPSAEVMAVIAKALTGQLSTIKKELAINQEKQKKWNEELKNKENQKDREEALITTGSHAKMLTGFMNLNIQDEFDPAAAAPKEKPQYKSFKVKVAPSEGSIAKHAAALNLTFRPALPHQAQPATPAPSTAPMLK